MPFINLGGNNHARHPIGERDYVRPNWRSPEWKNPDQLFIHELYLEAERLEYLLEGLIEEEEEEVEEELEVE